MNTDLKVLRRLSPGEAADQPGALERIAKTSWNGRLDLAALLGELASGNISAWAVDGAGSGLVLLRVEQSPTRRVLLVDGLAGHNIVTKGEAIGEDLKTIARVFHCKTIEGTSADPRWAALCRRIGFVPVCVTYEMEIS